MELTRAQAGDAAAIFEAWLHHQASMRGVPGVSYGIGLAGAPVVLGAVGTADLAGETPAGPDTGYRVASITKTFTASLIMQLVEGGRVRLDDPVGAHLEWLPDPLVRSGVTVRHLLTHSGGLPADESCAWAGDDFPDRERLHRELVARPAIAEPGSGFLYSNIAYALLGEIVEATTGRPFARAIEHGILEPLGLMSSGTQATPDLRRSLATGYWQAAPSERPRPAAAADAGAYEPAGGLISTVSDLLAYQAAHLPGDPAILGEAAKREMQRIQWQRAEPPDHGLGWMLWHVDGVRVLGHSGGYPGFATKIGFAPDLRLTATVLTNTIGPLPGIAIDAVFHTAAAVLSLWDGPEATPAEASGARLARLAGRYRGNWGERIVARVNRTLYLLDPQSDQPMHAPARLEQADATALRFTVASNDDYGHRGDPVEFELDSRGRPQTVRYGPHHLTAVA